jgi:hypothetical protein
MGMKFIIHFLFIILFASCVGTVEDPKKKDTSIFLKNKGDMKYVGIHSAVAESHRKIRCYFPESDFNGGILNYIIYMNGNYLIPVASISHNTLKKNPNGMLSVVIEGLEAQKKYDFTVRIQLDLNTIIEDENIKIVSTTTFKDEMPLFSGILGLDNLAGIDGTTKLKPYWSKAVTSANAIAGYTIYYRKKTEVDFQTMRLDDPELTDAVISGLTKDTDYIVNVKAFDNQGLEENNQEFASLRTLDDTLVIFPGIDTATVPANSLGFNNLLVTWPKAQGPVVKYRVYWTDNLSLTSIIPAIHNFPGNIDDVKFLDILDLRITSKMVEVGARNLTFKMAVVGCLNTNCTTYNAASVAKILSATTTPPVAPFPGLSEVKFGIDFANVSWLTMPDESKGAYNTYIVSTVAPNGNETPLSGVNNLSPWPLQKSIQSVQVKGLTEGVNVCLKVKSSITEPDNSIRTAPNTVQICGTPQYKRPSPITWVKQVIQDPESVDPLDLIETPCYNQTTNSFKVKWAPPEGEGTFSSYAIFMTEGDTVDFNDPDSLVQIVQKSTLEWTFSGYNPDTLYAVGIKAYFNHNGVPKYGINSPSITCKTNLKPVQPQGWFSIMSLGSKTDGLNDNAIIPEAFINKGESILNPGTPGGPSAQIFPALFTMPVDFSKIWTYYGWDPEGQNISTLDSQGMIRLAWKDFHFAKDAPGDPTIYFSYNSQSVSLGYNVYRMDYKHSLHATARPQKNSNLWGTPINSVPIKAKNVVTFQAQQEKVAEFVDFNFPAEASDQAKVYWYKIEPMASGNQVPLESDIPDIDYKDYIVKVILPPKNTSLIHRWMANQETCLRMGRTSDRSNQYRCPYNGLATKGYPTNSPTSWYYDTGGHIVMDRFELSCNFSRNRCNNQEQKKSYWICPDEGGPCTFEPYEPDDGDCITANFNSPSPTTGVAGVPLAGSIGSGIPPAVHYNRRKFDTHSCRIYLDGSWKDVNSADLARVAPAITNAANMPPLTRVTQTRFNQLCALSSVKLVEGNTNTIFRTYPKRLQRKQEFVLASAPPIDSQNHNAIYDGDHSLGCNIKWATGLPITVYKGMVQPGLVNESERWAIEKLKSINANNFSKHNAGEHGQRIGELDLRTFRFPTTTLFDAYDYDNFANNGEDNSKNIPKTGPVFASGSQGIGSTMMCLSRYGLQDMIGNVPEWSADLMKCHSTNGYRDCSPDPIDTENMNWSYKSAKNETYTMLKPINNTTPSVGTPLSIYFDNDDPNTNQEIMTMHAVTGSFPQYTTGLNPYSNTSMTHFISLPLGLPLACIGGACKNGAAFDDNALASVPGFFNSSGIPGAISEFNINNDAAKALSLSYEYEIGGNGGDNSKPGNLSFILGGFPCAARNINYTQFFESGIGEKKELTYHECHPDKKAPGRYSFDLTKVGTAINDLGGRCSTMIKEDELGNFL